MTPAVQHHSAQLLQPSTLLPLGEASYPAMRPSRNNCGNNCRNNCKNVDTSMSEARLRKHADYQHVYKSSRKHFSPSMSYFFCPRTPLIKSPHLDAPELQAIVDRGPRIGLTVGRVMGKAVDRNRIKRRMRAAVRLHVSELQHNVDVVLHPRRSVLTIEFAKLNAEVGRIFTVIRKALEAAAIAASSPTKFQTESTTESTTEQR